ncbi:putative oxidoreductase [Fulvivirga imtechensis AK7]|uniref:Putative oxidoreductase n=1 Tax=Fulvivirga imtechensis AK7 TaxID=1237149 RepID=L8JPU8_9BACT|nr:SDR family oxidoreductase [Fulvivirga imtechensis]ELR70855.1 putative oxidoreductase [Fulvivirga imtechensis AK7]
MNKIAVVTGGTKGIGKALVDLFSEYGFDIAVCSRNSEQLNILKKEIEQKYDNRVYVMKTDMAEQKEVLRFAEYIGEQDGEVEILVNNAGIFIPGQIHTEEDGVLEMTINTNLYSAYHMTRALIHGMKKRKSGHIFNICSTASFVPYVNGGSYCISKFAMLGMSKVLREEMKEHGVRVTSVMPGATLTASWEGVDLPEDRFMRPEDVAAAIWNAYKMSDRTVIEEIVMRPQLGDI